MKPKMSEWGFWEIDVENSINVLGVIYGEKLKFWLKLQNFPLTSRGICVCGWVQCGGEEKMPKFFECWNQQQKPEIIHASNL
jgi:hypothetical protein